MLPAACLIAGLPKAAVVNQNRLLTVLAAWSSNGITADDVIYLNLPLYHTAGFFVGFIGSIETGETMLNCRRSNRDVEKNRRVVDDDLCTHLSQPNPKPRPLKLQYLALQVYE